MLTLENWRPTKVLFPSHHQTKRRRICDSVVAGGLFSRSHSSRQEEVAA
jgi:hypothetical protein